MIEYISDLIDYIYLNSNEEIYKPYNDYVVSFYSYFDILIIDYGYVNGEQKIMIKKNDKLIATVNSIDDKIDIIIDDEKEYEILMLKYMYKMNQK